MPAIESNLFVGFSERYLDFIIVLKPYFSMNGILCNSVCPTTSTVENRIQFLH